ncbi:Transcription initiation factor TFIID subunit 9 [Dissostichus eleginoides]|uniref:Transcription initiation factor TFIID subunit 9 n=1 Tax=Dissostichus eleginoides TaxID=100907 RepID=A0AAD9BF15_DISEL|nr:Transcription initiation factor TFIID subunit 9 [Dissostichus eleginoides]
MAAPKNIPKDAQVMIQILKDMGITEYEPRVINQMLEFTYRYVTTIIEDAKIYATHAKKSTVDADDIKLAIQCRMDQSFTSPPPRDFLLEPYTGPRLPPDRYCLTAPNYRLKTVQKKLTSSSGRITVPRLSIGAVSSRPSTPTLGAPSVQKVMTPVTLSGQRFTVQIPPSQTTIKTTTPSSPGVSNVLINPSLIGSKSLLISSSLAGGGVDSLKRKHEDDDDYDAL